MKPNPYETLGLSANASQTEIVRAYRRLARQFHPDRQPPERKVWAEEQMKRLNEAYAILGDPQVRARYDAGLGLRTDPSSTPKRGTAHHPPGEWHQLFTWTKLAFWSLVIGFLFVGAYLALFDWRHIFQDPLQVQRYPWQWAMAGAWLVLFTVTALKLIPPRK